MDIPVLRLVVPLLVMDELDRKRYGTDSNTVSRAKAAQRMLLDLFSGTEPGKPVRVETTGRTVTMEVFMDEPGHRRLEHPDDEIIDRAAFMQQLLGPARPVHILTHDGGMRLRAQAAGLRVLTIPEAHMKDQSPGNMAAALTTEARRATELGSKLQNLADRAGAGDV